MPNIAQYHPQIVHFIIALAFVGIGTRIVSLIPLGPRFRFTDAMATTLIVLAAIAGIFGVKSGAEAHGPAERVPGARAAVEEHEEAGEYARTVLLVLAAIEIGTLIVVSKPKIGTAARAVAAVAGLFTATVVFKAGERGGEVVYSYAGNVGLRSGDTADVRNLLVAGLYHRAMKLREAGAKADAARLIEELNRQLPNDADVQMLSIESLIRDQDNPRAALGILNNMPPAGDNMRAKVRRGMMTADAYVAAGVPDSARLVLEALKAGAPAGRTQEFIQQAIDKLPRAGS